MARIARIVAAGYPHHITQRGNRRQQTFFIEDDYRCYIELLAEWCGRHNVTVWAYCLMPNHVHLVAVPGSEEGLRRAIGEAHRRYTRRINFRMGWRGHLWQGRFSSFPMDESYLLAVARYIEMNPVQAGMVTTPDDYLWSSARHHLHGVDDPLVRQSPLRDLVPDWAEFLRWPAEEQTTKVFKRAERTGRPVGAQEFVEGIEQLLGKPLRPAKPGPRKKN